MALRYPTAIAHVPWRTSGSPYIPAIQYPLSRDSGAPLDGQSEALHPLRVVRYRT